MSSGWSRVAQPQFVPRGVRLARLFEVKTENGKVKTEPKVKFRQSQQQLVTRSAGAVRAPRYASDWVLF